MRNLWLAGSAVLVFALAGCSDSEDAAAPTTTTTAATTTPKPAVTTVRAAPATTTTLIPDPERTAIDWTMQKDGARIDIRIVSNYAPENLQEVFDTVKRRNTEPDGYFVQMRCDSTDVVLGNGKFAVGAIGAARTGLAAGQGEFELTPGAVCDL